MLEVWGGYDYDVYVECKTCRKIITRSHDPLSLDDLIALSASHACGEGE
jgi:hypothetical protein